MNEIALILFFVLGVAVGWAFCAVFSVQPERGILIAKKRLDKLIESGDEVSFWTSVENAVVKWVKRHPKKDAS